MAAAVAAVVFPTPLTASAAGTCDVPDGEAAVSSAEHRMVELINAARSGEGLGPLTISPALSRAAAWKSFDSTTRPGDSFGHTDSLGRDASTRAADCGYPHPVGENIAAGFDGVRATFDAWMNSPGHRQNILGPQYVVIGAGVGPGNAWTTVFGMDAEPAATAEIAAATATPTQPPAPTATPVPPTPTPLPPTPTLVPPTATATAALIAPTATPVPPTATAVPPMAMPAPRRQVFAQLALGTNPMVYEGPASSVAASTASLGDSLVGVYAWDEATESWLRYLPGLPAYVQTLTELTPGMQLQVIASSAAQWSAAP